MGDLSLDSSNLGNIGDEYLSNVQFNKDVTNDDGVNNDGSIKGSGQIDQQAITKDTLGISDHTGVDGAKGNKGNVDSKLPGLPEGKDSNDIAALSSYWVGASIALVAVISFIMAEITKLAKQINATETEIKNENSLASRDSAVLSKDQMDDAADEKRTGGSAALGIALTGAAVQTSIASRQASNLTETQANAKGGQKVFDPQTKQEVLDPETGKTALTKGDDKAWDVGRMKSDQLSSQSQIVSGVQGGVSQMASAQYDAASMEDQAQSQLTQDGQQAYAKAADAADQEKKEEGDQASKTIDALSDVMRKKQEANAQILKG